MIRAGDVILLCALTLLAIGVVMVNSAGLSLDPRFAVTVESILTSRPVWYAGAAILALLVASRIPIATIASQRGLLALTPLLLPFVLLALVAVYIPGVGHEANHSRRWLMLPVIPGGLSFQPSELAKWAMIPIVAWWCWAQGPKLKRYWPGLLPVIAVVGLVAAIIAIEDLGTAVLITAVAGLLILAAGGSVLRLTALVPLAIPPAALLFTGDNAYRLQRLVTFMDPYADPERHGYHMIQSLIAVANGNATGRGLGFGLQKFGYLPEDRTDFLFAIICEETGIAGAAAICLLYIALIWAGLTIARRQTHTMLKLVALGIVATIGFQAMINLTVVTGLAPTKGIALPLLSAGGTGWVFTAACLGLLMAMDRATPAPLEDEDSGSNEAGLSPASGASRPASNLHDDEPGHEPAVA